MLCVLHRGRFASIRPGILPIIASDLHVYQENRITLQQHFGEEAKYRPPDSPELHHFCRMVLRLAEPSESDSDDDKWVGISSLDSQNCILVFQRLTADLRSGCHNKHALNARLKLTCSVRRVRSRL